LWIASYHIVTKDPLWETPALLRKSLLPFTAESWVEKRTPPRLIGLDSLALLVTAVFSDDYDGVSEGSGSLPASSGDWTGNRCDL
jgi:hypothetical protein